MSDIKYATRIGMTTLIGSFGKYPRESGNCFSVHTKNKKEYRIMNFNVENLKECIRRGVDWPIKIKVYGKRHAVIYDSRIPPDWYDNEFCEICSPYEFWPEPQKLRRELAKESGVIKDCGNGIISRIFKQHKYEGFEDLYKEPNTESLGYTYEVTAEAVYEDPGLEQVIEQMVEELNA